MLITQIHPFLSSKMTHPRELTPYSRWPITNWWTSIAFSTSVTLLCSEFLLLFYCSTTWFHNAILVFPHSPHRLSFEQLTVLVTTNTCDHGGFHREQNANYFIKQITITHKWLNPSKDSWWFLSQYWAFSVFYTDLKTEYILPICPHFSIFLHNFYSFQFFVIGDFGTCISWDQPKYL